MDPILGTLLAKGLSLLGNAFLSKGKAWVEEKTGIKLEAQMSEETLSRLKIAEMEHEDELLRLQLEDNRLEAEIFKARLEDTKSARERESVIATSEHAPYLNKIITPVLAIGILFLTFVLFYLVLFKASDIDPAKKDIIIYVLGVLSAISTQVVSYYFGTSSGSQSKDTLIKMLTTEKGK